jgi:23S rRNA (cytosine1962-C5)-methyltransferase
MLPFADAVRAAWDRRAALHDDPHTDVYRVLHGFGEGAPGVAIDRLGSIARVRVHGEGPGTGETAVAVAGALAELYPFRAVVARTAAGVAVARGELDNELVTVREHGLLFEVEPLASGDVGLYLDARPARAWLRANSLDRRVLDLFAHTGALGTAAAVGGARSVVHVDQQKRALSRAAANRARNGLSVDPRDFVRDDVVRVLRRVSRTGARLDGIIMAPAPRLPRRGESGPRRDDPELIRLAAHVLRPEGWLLYFFHRGGERAERERGVVDAAGGELEVVWRGASGDDFPERSLDDKLRVTAFARRACVDGRGQPVGAR